MLSLIHPLKTLHGSIPLKQMENFLKEISDSEPELTPEIRQWKASHGSSKGSTNSTSPLVRDLAESIPQGQDGIDVAEFESVFEKETSV